MKEEKFEILSYLNKEHEITIKVLSKKLKKDRTTVIRTINRLNMILKDHDMMIKKGITGYKIDVNNNTTITSLCTYYGKSHIFLEGYLVKYLKGDCKKSYYYFLHNSNYYSKHQIYYKFKKLFGISFSKLKNINEEQKIVLYIKTFCYLYNDYIIRKNFVSHSSIKDIIVKENLCNCDSNDYLVIAAILYYEKRVKKEMFCKKEIIKQIKMKNNSDLLNIKEVKNLINYYKNNTCYILPKRNKLINSILINENELYYEFNDDRNLFFLNYYIYNIKNNSSLVSDKRFEIIIVNVMNDFYTLRICKILKINFPNATIKNLSSWYFYENSDKFEKVYFNSPINIKQSIIPQRDHCDNYTLKDFFS